MLGASSAPRAGLTLELAPRFILSFVQQLTVSKLAEQVGTSADTVRYYERIGLLPQPERTPAGYRIYDDNDADLLAFIKSSQRLGLSLEEIRELLGIKERGLCPCGHTRTLLERRMAELDEEMDAIQRLRGDIAHLLGDFDPTGSEGWQCGSELLQIKPAKVRAGRRKGGDT